jgi:uncharacterized protein (TIGR03437 family)
VALTLTDSTGVRRAAQIYAVASNVVNFIVPGGTAPGLATLQVTGSVQANGTALLGATAPGLFTTNQTGQGPAAAQVISVHPDGSQSIALTFRCDPSGQNCVNVPIDFGDGSNQLTLVLYGTGIRGFSAGVQATINNIPLSVAHAGAQPTLAGLDQVNVPLPISLRGRGQLVVVVSVDGQATNMVQVAFQ